MMNTVQMITYIVILYFHGSAHRYVVDAANEADALEAALVEYSTVEAESPRTFLHLRDFTITIYNQEEKPDTERRTS